MLKQLLEETLIKLLLEKENKNKTVNGSFVFFVNEILEKKYQSPNLISERTLIDYYRKHVEGIENNSKEPDMILKNYMAKFLGYNDYFDFEITKKAKFSPQKKARKSLVTFDSKKIHYFIVGVLFSVLLFHFQPTKSIYIQQYEFVRVNNDSIQNKILELNHNSLEFPNYSYGKFKKPNSMFSKLIIESN